ncbi:MAG: formylglycine-generating enzyme family protein [Nitrospirae bacterium]|nr:formylglycine-generating enzyme family protein [Nitrospirota bacterium]
MKQYRIIFAMMFLLSFAVLAGCAGSLPQQAIKLDPVEEPIALEFVFVKGGCFQRSVPAGPLADGDIEKPAYEVCVSDFYLSKYEATQNQWQEVMGDNPAHFKQCGTNCPVEFVSWDMAQEYMKKLNAASGKQYRLPTEAEWEYAARSGGKKERWSGTDDETKLGEYAWYSRNSGNTTHKVGQKKSNALGLHDMTGNVYEWCQDWFNESYYEESLKDNPMGADSGMHRVLRGGSWEDDQYSQRTDDRGRDEPAGRGRNNGFRLLLPATK